MNKKGTVIGILTALGFLIALLIYLSFGEDVGQYEKYLGDIQIKVLDAYYNGETLMFFYDKVIEYSVYDAVYKLGDKGGFKDKSECGQYENYNIWYDITGGRECYPSGDDLEEGFFNFFEESFNNKISNSVYNEFYNYDDYLCRLFDFEGKKHLIECGLKNNIEYNIEVSRELVVRESVIPEADRRLFVEIFESGKIQFSHFNDREGFKNGGLVKRIRGPNEEVQLDVRIAQFLKMAVDSDHSLTLSSVIGTHSWNVAGTSRESRHWAGYAFDIAVVNGVIVNGCSSAVKEFQEWIVNTFDGTELIPSQVIGPCKDFNINRGQVTHGFYDQGHQNHIHVGY